MASKNITVTEDAYDRFAGTQADGESFSELVVRLTERADPMAFAGSCPGLGDRVETARDDVDDDLDERHDELFGWPLRRRPPRPGAACLGSPSDSNDGGFLTGVDPP